MNAVFLWEEISHRIQTQLKFIIVDIRDGVFMNSYSLGNITDDVLFLVYSKSDREPTIDFASTFLSEPMLFRRIFLQVRDCYCQDCIRRLLTIASMIKINRKKISELCQKQSFNQSSKARLLVILDKIKNLHLVCSTTKSIKYKFFFKIIKVVTKLVVEMILAVARMPNAVLLL